MKNSKTLLIFFVLTFILTSCGTSVANTQKDTPILEATLPPTLTPLPTSTVTQPQATPTALYTPIPLSKADDEVYQKALNDIPIYRQGDLQLSLKDNNGNPLSGYQIKYHQTSHAFLFGGSAENFKVDQLRQIGINTLTVGMDWSFIQPEYGKYTLEFQNYWTGIDELKTGGMKIRTNVLFGMSDSDIPSYWQNISFDEFVTRVDEHISTTVRQLAPSVDYWEAILEPNFGNHNSLNLSKDQYYQTVSTSIDAIRENDPTALVEINLSYPCGGIEWLNNFDITQDMLDRNIDFDVIGLQLYYNAYTFDNVAHPKYSFSQLSACFDKYEEILVPYGKKIVASEVSVPSEAPKGQTGYWGIPWTEDTQAQYLTTLYTILFSKPSNLGIVWWNTIEPSPFIVNGGLIKADNTPKKSYYTLQNLITSWTTNGEGSTDQNGNLSWRRL